MNRTPRSHKQIAQKLAETLNVACIELAEDQELIDQCVQALTRYREEYRKTVADLEKAVFQLRVERARFPRWYCLAPWYYPIRWWQDRKEVRQ